MVLYESLERIEKAFVPILSGVLRRVRAKKEEIMSEKWGCPIENCDYEHPTKRAVNIHLSTSHKMPKGTPGRPEPVPLSAEDEAAPAPQEAAPEAPASTPAPTPAPQPEDIAQEQPPEAQPQAQPEQPPAVVPPFPPPAPPPPTRMTSVPLGSAIMLNGPTWWQNPATRAWESSIADKLPVQVVTKEVSGQGDVMLICRAEGGTALWSVQEAQVLSGAVKLLKLAPVNPTLESEASRPADGPRQIEDPDYNYFEEQRREQEVQEARESERKEYGERLSRYTTANRRKKNAEKEFETVRTEEYDKLFSYVKKHGEPSEPGKHDWQVIDFDHCAHIVRRPGDSGIKRNTEVIIQWLLDNEMTDCLTDALDVAAWEKAKKEGRIPADFIREVEQPYKNPDSFQFRVDPV